MIFYKLAHHRNYSKYDDNYGQYLNNKIILFCLILRC